MKKKLIGLSMLLLGLLLGLFTTSYANSYRDFTETEIKNVLYKAWVNAGHSETDVINAITTHENNGNITTIVNALNNTNNCIISFDTGSTGYNSCYIACYNSASNTHPYFYDGRIFFKNRPSGTLYQIFFNGTFSTGTSIYYGYSTRTDYIYYGDTFYNSSSGTTVTHPANTYSPSTFFDEWYYQDALPFAFVTEPGLGTVMYDNYEYTLYNKPSSGDILLGQLFVPNGIVVNYADVLNYYWYWNNWQVREFSNDCIRTQLVSNDEGNLVFNVFLKRNYIYNNTYYQYIFTSTQSEPYEFVSGGCYINDSHTVITNGVVDPNNTFSGDYKDEYDSIIDNQQDVNNISEAIGDTILDDSEVDNMLSGFNTSGDILNTLGYSPIENPFSSVILRVIQALNDVLLGSGDVTLNLSAFELDMEINSSDFTLPNGLIKNFVSLVSNGFMIWVIYKYGFKLYMMINTGKFKNLIDETTNTNVNLF